MGHHIKRVLFETKDFFVNKESHPNATIDDYHDNEQTIRIKEQSGYWSYTHFVPANQSHIESFRSMPYCAKPQNL